MKNMQSEVILELTEKLKNLFGPKADKILEVNFKVDKSVVTEIDLFVSDILKNKLSGHKLYKNYSFFSEEDFDQLVFPAAIVDPIDGTREFVKGRAECAISMALMKTPEIAHKDNYGWLYNPFSGFSLDSSMVFLQSNSKSTQKILGMVSRSEFDKGYFKNFINTNPKIDITPRGSIAFKLGLLASGGCDFVVSLSPKNIWDIAAGSILCSQREIYLYQNGVQIHYLDQLRVDGILVWAPECLAVELLEQFKKEKK